MSQLARTGCGSGAASALEMTWATLAGGAALGNQDVSWDAVSYYPATQTNFSWEVTNTHLSMTSHGIYLFFVFWNSIFAAGKFVQTQLFISGTTYFEPGFNLQRHGTDPSDHILTGSVPQLYPVGAPSPAQMTVKLTTNNVGGTVPINCTVQVVYLGA